VTVTEIITEIEHLAPLERERIAGYLRGVEETRPLTGLELTNLAGMLADLTSPADVHALKERIAAGFYGKHA